MATPFFFVGVSFSSLCVKELYKIYGLYMICFICHSLWSFNSVLVVFQRSVICDALRDFVPLVQIKNVKNTHRGVLGLNLRLKPEALLKVTLLHVCFSRFLNCTNDTKLRKASHMKSGCSLNMFWYNVISMAYFGLKILFIAFSEREQELFEWNALQNWQIFPERTCLIVELRISLKRLISWQFSSTVRPQ